METTTPSNFNYNSISVPTNLFFALDGNLRNALVVLLQLSSVFADSDGFFYRSIKELTQDFKIGRNLTIAVLESLYQYGLLEVRTNHRQTSYYRINTSKFKEWEKYNFNTITNTEELHLNTINYKEKGFKVTYNTGNTPLSLNQSTSEETPSQIDEKGLERQEMANPEIENTNTQDTEELDLDFVLSSNSGVDESEELKHILSEFEESTIETASVVPTPQVKIETRALPSKLDKEVVEKCEALVERYVEMVIPSSNESLDKCNKAIEYITKQFNQGFITEEKKKELTKKLIQERFKKHRI